MKITLQASENQTRANHPYPTVQIEIPRDDLRVDEVLENLIRPALVAWGFTAETVIDKLNLEP